MYLVLSDSAASINLSLSASETFNCSANNNDFSRYFCASCSNLFKSSSLVIADSTTDLFYWLVWVWFASFFYKFIFLADKFLIILSLSSTSINNSSLSLSYNPNFSANS